MPFQHHKLAIAFEDTVKKSIERTGIALSAFQCNLRSEKSGFTNGMQRGNYPALNPSNNRLLNLIKS